MTKQSLTFRFFVVLALVGASACRSPEPDGSAREERRATGGGAETPSAMTVSAMEPAPEPEPTPEPQVNDDQAPLEGVEEVAPPPGERNPALLDPSLANETAPETFAVRLNTTAGEIIIDVTRAWAPVGADRFYNLVKIGAFDDIAFFRVLTGFMAQTGLHGDPAVSAAWRNANIQDDPVTQSNTRGMVTFAKTGMPNSRVQQFFINFGNNARLDSMGFAPFGRVRDMTVADQINSETGERPNQAQIQSQGNTYLRQQFPNLTYITTATILERE